MNCGGGGVAVEIFGKALSLFCIPVASQSYNVYACKI